jgi:gliding motility-associated lipoprotein GldK
MLTKLEMNMKGILNSAWSLLLVGLVMASCGKAGKTSKGPSGDGQLHAVSAGGKYIMPKPPGMIYVPSGTFHMGPSDEDISQAFTARNKQVSINGFWMDATEITNDEYRMFVYWVRDSIAASILNYKKNAPDGTSAIDWAKARMIKWGDPKIQEQLSAMIVTPDNRINGRKELDAKKIIYHSEVLDYKEAARRENADKPRSNFIVKKDVVIYPDTLVWIRDFSYSYNEPLSKKYFSHPAYGSYPVVGISWKMATAFCEWRTHYLNSFLEAKKRITESDFRLPTEAEWEYAARGGRSQVPYPWGGPYLRNKKGCLLANFKPGRGNYPEDGGFYTVRADAYWPNDFGLYNMAGNVAEWTSSLYYEGSYNFQHDMNPEIRWNAVDNDPPRMKRKVVRGGSWKDVGYFLQNSSRNFEYQDTTKSYLGFRCVVDLPPMQGKK